MGKARTNAVEEFEKELEPFLKYVGEKKAQDLSSLSVKEVVEEIRERRRRVMNDFGKESLKPGFFGGLARGALEMSLMQLMGDQLGKECCAVLTSGLEGDTTVEQNAVLYGVAHGEAEMDAFVEKFGHRTVNEMELAEPRWREDQSYLEQMMGVYRLPTAKSPEELHRVNKVRRQEAEAGLPEKLAEWGGSSQLEEFRDLIGEAQTLLPYRETGKHYLMMGYEVIRLGIMELARRWDLGRDTFFLRFDELERFEAERDALMEKVEKRKVRWQSVRRLEHPHVVDSNEIDNLGLPEEIEAASEYKADALAAGVVVGRAHIVFDPKEAGELGADCILVCPSTDPGWTALFASIKALIVERGGALSHGAITARDFGIPAVACPDATKKITEGMSIRVDGNQGRITVLEE
jgi:pyruvate,water dikinase